MNVIELTQSLIKINSINPKSSSLTIAADGEKNIAEFIESYLKPHGFETEFLYIEKDRPNIIIRHKSFDEKLPTVALEAHLDTVDVDSMTIEPFEGFIKQGKLWGRGACDVKGTMAAMLTSLLNWYKSETNNVFNVIFIGTMGEEAGTLGSMKIAHSNLPLNMVLVGEPTSLRPVIGHKGLWRFALEAIGKACHSSRPEQGINAIDIMMDIFNLLKSQTIPDFEKTHGNTMNITNIQGGSTINMIPDLCRLQVDSRYAPETDIVTHREKLIHSLEFMSGGIKGNIQFQELENHPAFHARKESHLLNLLENSLFVLMVDAKPKFETWYSDAGHFSSANYDTIVWGAGSITQAHTADEFIAVDQLDRAVLVLDEFLKNCHRFYSK